LKISTKQAHQIRKIFRSYALWYNFVETTSGMQKKLIILGGILGALAVAIGAFGAHGLAAILQENNRADTFETAVKYHFYHAIGIILLAVLIGQRPAVVFYRAGWAMAIGIFFFSGSLYTLSLTSQTWLGAVAPIGGVAFVLGWVLLAWGAWKSSNS
jgi:uncharacterized membrane protein YgdD (TMEM256/DUF423 family)